MVRYGKTDSEPTWDIPSPTFTETFCDAWEEPVVKNVKLQPFAAEHFFHIIEGNASNQNEKKRNQCIMLILSNIISIYVYASF